VRQEGKIHETSGFSTRLLFFLALLASLAVQKYDFAIVLRRIPNSFVKRQTLFTCSGLPIFRLFAIAKHANIEYHTVSMHAANAHARGIILGFAAFTERQIQMAVRRWAESLQ